MTKPTTEDIVRRATAAFNAGQRDEARKLCEQGLTRRPGDAMLNHLLAAVLVSQGEIRTARQHIETSLASRPGHAAAQLLAGRIARLAGDFDAALSHLDRVIAQAPQREAFLEKARTLDQASLKQASLKQASLVHPSLRSQARAAWQAILDVVPASQEAAARLGRLAWEDGEHSLAATLLERAVAQDAPAPVWFDLGVARQDLRDRDGAATAYRKALAIKPDYAEAATNLGTVLQEAGDLDGAMRAYATAYRLRPETFGTIAMALTSAPHGRLWLDEATLRAALA